MGPPNFLPAVHGGGLSDAQENKAGQLEAENLARMEKFVAPLGKGATASLHANYSAVMQAVGARTGSGGAGPGLRYGVSEVLAEDMGKMSPPQFLGYLGRMAKAPNAFTLQGLGETLSASRTNPIYYRAEEATAAFVKEVTGRDSNYRPFDAFKNHNGLGAYAAGFVDRLSQEAGDTGEMVVGTVYNPVQAARGMAELGRKLSDNSERNKLIQGGLKQLEEAMEKTQFSDYHKGFFHASAVIAVLDVKDAAESLGKLKNLAGEFKAGRIHDIKDVTSALNGPTNRVHGDTPHAGGKHPSPGEGLTVNYRPDPKNPGAYIPDFPDTPRTRLPNAEQANLMTRALGVDGSLGGHVSREITQWSARTGGQIEKLYRSPDVLYGKTRESAGLLGEALMDAAKIPADQRKAAHVVLAGVRDNMKDKSGRALADMYETMLPGKSNHAEFKKQVASYDKVMDAAAAAELRQTPKGRQTLPAQEQASLLVKEYQVEGKLAPYLKREIVDWAQGRPKNAIENLGDSGAELFGDGTVSAKRKRVNGVAGEALADLVSTPANRKAVESVISDLRQEAAAAGLKGRVLMATFEEIATPGSQNRKNFDKRVSDRQVELEQLRRETPDGRQTLPVKEQAALLMKGYGVEGKLAPYLEREIVDWAQGRKKNAIENLGSSLTELFGDGTVTAQRKRMNGVAGEALADAVSTPVNRKAVDSVINEIRYESSKPGDKAIALMAKFEAIATPGTEARLAFDKRVSERQVEMEAANARQNLPAKQQAEQLLSDFGVKGRLAENLQVEIEIWAHGKPKGAIESLRSDSLEMFGSGNSKHSAGLMGQALIGAVAQAGNRDAVVSVVRDLRIEASQQNISRSALAEQFGKIATEGTPERQNFDARVAARQTELGMQAPVSPDAGRVSDTGQRLLNPAPENAPDVGVRIHNQTTGSVSVSAPPNSSIGVDVQNSTTGSIQTVSGTGNTQVAGNRDTLRDSTTRPDANGNVQTTNAPGVGVVLNHPGTSGNTGTNVRIENSTVNGSVQSIIGNQNIQIDINEARINGDRRQTVTDGDNNRQTQNLGANVTAESVTQTIGGRSDSRQQIGNDVPAPSPDVSVTGSLSWVQGNRNSVVQGDGNNIRIGAGNNAVINGVRVETPTPETSTPRPVDGRLSGGVQDSTVNGSLSAVQGHQNTVVEGNGNTVRIGGNNGGEERRAIEDPDPDDREIVPKGGNSSYLKGQSVAYTPRFSTQHGLTGESDGKYTTISGHGVIESDYASHNIGNSVQRDTFVVPQGVNLHFLGLPGSVITDRLGQRADVGGDLTGVPLMKLGASDTAPDILITPDFGTINIKGNPITVDNPQGVRLSQLIRDHDLSGNIVVSSCLAQSVSHADKDKWAGITFDLPDRYPKPDPPDLSDLPPRLPIDPNFHTQHGLTNSGDGKYTAIGGNAGLSNTNPNHGKLFAEQSFTVPEGVTVYFPSLPGGSVHNRLAEAIEKGEDLSRIPLLKAGAGSTAPDPLLLPGRYEVAGNFVRITDQEGQRLSEVIKEHGLTGNVVVAAGLDGRNRPHSNVLFDLPEEYPQRSAPGGTRSFDLTPQQTIAPQPQSQSQPPARRSLEADADNSDRIVAQTPDQRNLLQRTWDSVLDTRLPAVANISVYAQQSGPDAKWQASLPLPAGEAIHKLQEYMANNIRGNAQASVDDVLRPASAATNKLQEYMANNARGDSQASVDDFLRLVDPRRVADVKLSPPSTLAGGVDFVTGVQRVQSLKVEIDGANVEGGALRWDPKVSAYQLNATADAGGYVLNAPLKVTPGEAVTPLSVSGARLTGPAANAVDFPGVSVKMSDEYGAITLPAGTRLSAENVGLMNSVLANPEYRSRAGETQYGSSAKANYVVSEPRGDADARDNVFNRVFAGEYGALEAPKQKLEVNLSPALLGIHVSNPPMHGTRVGFELERVQGPTIRELMDGLREDIAPRPQTPPQDNRQSPLPAPPQPGDPAFDAYLQSTKAVEQLNASLNVPRSEATEKLVVAAATVAVQQNLRIDEVALNKPTAAQPGGTTAFVIEKTGNPETDRVGTVLMRQAMQTPLEEGYRSLAAATPSQTAAQSPEQTQEQEERLSARRLA